ncbi:MAG: LysR family transcriptional regulator [Leptolyngbyaceae cyanobacterium CSU_1_3]|nr:LysR family transcriptional regulator [Leptolyngbyaceae cyanobacterium CSU_1_3]
MNKKHIQEQAINLADIDLNLLVAFDALLSERSVSEAASRLGLTQPAMSKRLAKLRQILRDDILVRTSEGMQPTERAMDLAEPIQAALRLVESALDSHFSFQPTHSNRIFRIATTDLVAVVLIPELIRRLQISAPNLSLILRVPASELRSLRQSMLEKSTWQSRCCPMLHPQLEEWRYLRSDMFV